MKNLVFIIALLTAPAFGADINMTPQNTFSGYNNNGIRTTYPKLNNSHQTERTNRAEFMKPKSVREMGEVTLKHEAQMNYSQFPKNYDSSNLMHMQDVQNGMQNMFMGY